MTDKNKLSTLGSNLKCTVCNVKDCRAKYTPERKKTTMYGDTVFVDRCHKDVAKELKKKP